MRPKTIIIIIIVVLLTVTLLILTRTADATIIGMPKNNVIIAAIVLAFILGYMLGRPGRQSRHRYIPEDSEHTDSGTLSEEDRRYIE